MHFVGHKICKLYFFKLGIIFKVKLQTNGDTFIAKTKSLECFHKVDVQLKANFIYVALY